MDQGKAKILVLEALDDRRRMDAAFQEKELPFGTLMDHLPGMAYRGLNYPQWPFIFLTRGCKALTGYESEALCVPSLTSFADLIHDQDRQAVWDQVQDALRQDRRFQVEFRIRTADGDIKWVRSRGKSVARTPEGTAIIEGFICDINDVRQSQEALQASMEKYRAMVDNIPIGVALISPEMAVVEINRQMRIWFPHVDTKLKPGCHKVFFFSSDPRLCDHCPVRKTYEDGAVHEAIVASSRAVGGHRTFRILSSPINNGSGQVRSVILMMEDVTDRLEMETRLQQTQRLESIGRLAGGVAHDLNNLLSPILGYAEMLSADLGSDALNKDNLEEILRAGMRARELTRQLLTFGRKQPIKLQPIDLNQVIRGFENLLRRTIREDISIQYRLCDDLQRTEADAGQIEQVLMNLAINGQDAMPSGGRLLIETANVYLDESYAEGRSGITPGPYVLLSVSDTGVGMDERTLERVFEPFFTTKTPGEGTGLGLAMAYGIVKQHKGNIWAYSEPGKGSTFKIYLPLSQKPVQFKGPQEKSMSPARGHETVLVVEDQQEVRRLACRMLESCGYSVLSARDGRSALEMARNHPASIDLLLTDVVMPAMNGRELFHRLSAERPDLKVVFMSGYTDEVITHHGLLEKDVHLIQKPFSVKRLTCKVRQVLDSA